MDEGMVPRLEAAGVPRAALADYPNIPNGALTKIEQSITASRGQRWAIMQRGFMVHGVGSLADHLGAISSFTLDSRPSHITCPNPAVRRGERCTVSQRTQSAPADDRPHHAAEVPGQRGRRKPLRNGQPSPFNQRTFDWLEDVFATREDHR